MRGEEEWRGLGPSIPREREKREDGALIVVYYSIRVLGSNE